VLQRRGGCSELMPKAYRNASMAANVIWRFEVLPEGGEGGGAVSVESSPYPTVRKKETPFEHTLGVKR